MALTTAWIFPPLRPSGFNLHSDPCFEIADVRDARGLCDSPLSDVKVAAPFAIETDRTKQALTIGLITIAFAAAYTLLELGARRLTRHG